MTKKYDLTRVSVLVIDDNSHMLSINKTLLKGFGIRTIHMANNATDGFELFCKSPTDLILVDYAMPRVSGLDFIRRVRDPKKSPKIYVPIIMITAYSEISRVEDARDAGITEFLCKPISAKALFRRIVEIVERPRPFVRSKEFFGPDRRAAS